MSKNCVYLAKEEHGHAAKGARTGVDDGHANPHKGPAWNTVHPPSQSDHAILQAWNAVHLSNQSDHAIIQAWNAVHLSNQSDHAILQAARKKRAKKKYRTMTAEEMKARGHGKGSSCVRSFCVRHAGIFAGTDGRVRVVERRTD